MEEEAGQPASLHLPHTHHGLGSSSFTIDIYAAVLAAGDAGLTVKQLYERFKDAVAFDSATHYWWEKKVSGGDQILSFSLERDGTARIKKRVSNLVKSGVLVSLGKSPKGSRYVAGRPPKGFRPKTIPNPQRPVGYYDIDPFALQADSRRHIEVRTWLERARKELQRPGSRQLRALVEDAVRLLER